MFVGLSKHTPLLGVSYASILCSINFQTSPTLSSCRVPRVGLHLTFISQHPGDHSQWVAFAPAIIRQ